MVLFGALAELEKATILQRQKEGIQSAKARGRNLGRPKAQYPAEWEGVYNAWKCEKLTATAAMKTLGLHRTTFYMLSRRWEAQQHSGSPREAAEISPSPHLSSLESRQIGSIS